MAEVLKAVSVLTSTSVMVGVPKEKAGRKDGTFSNVEIAYVQDHGSIDGRIPARPFMEPGIKSVQDKIVAQFEEAGKVAFTGTPKRVEAIFNRIGLIASQGIKAKISEGIPPPLAASTIKGRISRIKGKKRRARIETALAGDEYMPAIPASRQAGAEGVFTPLIVTGALRNSITYVLRKVTGR
jgi:hypothetical protein